MTEPSPSRPVPGPPRPGGTAAASEPSTQPSTEGNTDAPFDDLAERPIAEHVAVFEAEHARLERELGTIDQL